MISDIFNTLLYEPFYNGFIFSIGFLPGQSVGLAVIFLTVVVKLVLLGLSYRSIKTQVIMRTLEPELTGIKEKYKDDRQKQATETMALYKEKGINPFSSFFAILIQIPIFIALYWVFIRSGLPEINADLLYPFVSAPDTVAMQFLGVDLSEKSVIISVLAGVTQFFQARLLSPPRQKKKEGARTSLKEEFAHSMQLQMRFVFPVIIGIIAYTLSAAVGLYFIVSGLFSIAQDSIVKRRLERSHGSQQETNSTKPPQTTPRQITS